MLDTTSVDALIVVPCIVGLAVSAYQWIAVSRVKIDGHPNILAKNDAAQQKKNAVIVSEMTKIAKTIQQGAMSFLMAEYTYMAVYIVLFSGILVAFTGWPTTVAFVVGAITSIFCGWIGMSIAVYTNVRTTHECWKDLKSGFDVAIQGGCVMGMSLVSLGILGLFVLIIAFKSYYKFETEQEMYEAIAGYGLGGSSIALFGRVGGGIYTKAADVGADLSGKNDYGLEEDDYRNPACIADNVGDNVGDIAGMGADLSNVTKGGREGSRLVRGWGRES
jgi:Na+/H+-translocating membrane pyrophosphatase